MKKLIYWIGIYRICVVIHDLPRTLMIAVDEVTKRYGKIRREIDKVNHELETKKEERRTNETLSSRSTNMVMDRIGF